MIDHRSYAQNLSMIKRERVPVFVPPREERSSGEEHETAAGNQACQAPKCLDGAMYT